MCFVWLRADTGCSIGDTICTMVEISFKTFLPEKDDKKSIKRNSDDNDILSIYSKWSMPCLYYLIRSICTSIIFYFQRIASTFHASIKGAKKVVIGSIKIYNLKARNTQSTPNQASDKEVLHPSVSILIVIVGMFGFYYQTFDKAFPVMKFILVPLKMLLMPLRFFEWSLMQLVVANMK